MATKKAVKRVPKLRRLLVILHACASKRKFYQLSTLQKAWSLAKGTSDRLWLADRRRRLRDQCCAECQQRFDALSDLPKINIRKELPAEWLKRWGGYEPVKKATPKKKAARA